MRWKFLFFTILYRHFWYLNLVLHIAPLGQRVPQLGYNSMWFNRGIVLHVIVIPLLWDRRWWSSRERYGANKFAVNTIATTMISKLSFLLYILIAFSIAFFQFLTCMCLYVLPPRALLCTWIQQFQFINMPTTFNYLEFFSLQHFIFYRYILSISIILTHTNYLNIN